MSQIYEEGLKIFYKGLEELGIECDIKAFNIYVLDKDSQHKVLHKIKNLEDNYLRDFLLLRDKFII